MPTEIELLATAVGSALGGGVLAVGGQELVRCWKRPRLHLSFEDKTAFFARTPINWPNDLANPAAGTTEYEAIYVRAKVVNGGRSIARDCRAYMSQITCHKLDGSVERIEEQDAIPLSWSLNPDLFRPIDIPVGINQFVDIAFTISKEQPPKLYPSGNFPNRFRRSWNNPGTFEIDLIVTAQDIQPSRATIKFKWLGPWDSLQFAE